MESAPYLLCGSRQSEKVKYNIDEPATIVQLQWVLEAIKQDTRAQVVPTI